MKLSDVVAQVVIDPRKLINYALDPENPVGSNKAIIFQRRLGYTKDNYEPLLQQIHAQALGAEAVPTQLDQHGQRYQVDLEVDGVEGQKAIVRTGWIVEPKANFARLVTLYVRKQP
uniref:DUF6883 domain-containing protein n=1 Tax=Cyanothece sp. (strain PCC 7425 / ATCC 29141) TaxID=395961 RepID=B8HZQ0_CYAP4